MRNDIELIFVYLWLSYIYRYTCNVYIQCISIYTFIQIYRVFFWCVMRYSVYTNYDIPWYITIYHRYTYTNHDIPSRKLTYRTLGKATSSSNMPYQGDMLVPWSVEYHDIRELPYHKALHESTAPQPSPLTGAYRWQTSGKLKCHREGLAGQVHIHRSKWLKKMTTQEMFGKRSTFR